MMKSKLFYQISGDSEPLLLISGLNADHLFWLPVAEELKNFFKVITFDNRGIGQSKIFEPECTTELMAADVIDLLDDLQIETAHIVGHSLGGCIAQQIAIRYPQRVKKLVLCSTIAKANYLASLSTKTIMKLMQTDIPRELLIKIVFTRLFGNTFLSDDTKLQVLISQALLQPAEESKRSYFYQANALLNHNVIDQLKKITCPTFVLSGEEDLLTLSHQVRAVAAAIDGAKFLNVANAGHMLPLEDSRLFCQAVRQFLT